MKYSLVILAGGKSSRMGFDKQMLRLESGYLLDSTVRILVPEFDSLFISTNDPDLYAERLTAWEKRYALPVEAGADDIPDRGPLGGILTALRRISGDYAYFIACDMPNVSIPYVRFLKELTAQEHPKAVSVINRQGLQVFHGMYRKDLAEDAEAFLDRGEGSVRKFFREAGGTMLPEKLLQRYTDGTDIFFNLNTPEELERYNEEHAGYERERGRCI